MKPLEVQVKKKTKKGANVTLSIDPDSHEVTFQTANSKEVRPFTDSERGDFFISVWMPFWYELSQLPYETERAIREKVIAWIEKEENGAKVN